MDIQTEQELQKAYRLITEGKINQAKQIFAEALEYNFDSEELNFAHWCCSYWDDFIQKLPKYEAYEQGASLIARWKTFHLDLERQNKSFQRPVTSLQKGIFTIALDAFESLSIDSSAMEFTAVQQAEIGRKLALCCKKLGKFDAALNHLTEANKVLPSSAPILAEIADCFALCGEDRKAKVLFREAFFIDAQKVETTFLDSELICCLIRQLKEKGYTGPALQEWIPVYGVLYGVFNIKRELRSHEVARLRQEIYARENELKDPSNDASVLTPKLINMYFWLIDHYVRTGESTARINDCLLQIRVHNENIYKMYTR